MTEIGKVKGVGPKTAKKLLGAGIQSAQDLADQSVDDLIALGIGKKTASNIIREAQAIADTRVEDAEPIKDKPAVDESAKEEKKPAPKKKTTKAKPKKERTTEDEEDIPTKKKKGVQIRKATKKAEKIAEEEKMQREGWIVKSKELSSEEIEKRKARAKIRSESDKITREIPTKLTAVKAVKKSKEKGKKPIKKEHQAKKVVKKEKIQKEVKDYYTIADLQHQPTPVRDRMKFAATGEKKPRSVIKKGTELGIVTSHERSRRDIQYTKVIVKLNDEFTAASLLGKRVKLTYPDNEKSIIGSISRTFAKKSSNKVIVKFNKGVRMAGMYVPVFAN